MELASCPDRSVLIAWLALAIVAASCLLPAMAMASPPLFLYGTEGDDDTMYRLEVNGVPPSIHLLGDVRDDVTNSHVIEMEAMTWDPFLGNMLIVSNHGSGPLYKVNPADITGPPAADIPATRLGSTNTIQMEGVALHLQTNILYGADNQYDPARLVMINKFNGQVLGTIGELEDASGEDYDNMEALAFTYDPPHVLYGANNPGDGWSTLVTINLSTGEVTPIGPIGFKNVECLTFAPDGTLYGFSNANQGMDYFITINTTTGAGTLFNTVDPSGLDIEDCVFLEPGIAVSVQEKTWSQIKTIFRD